MMFKHPGLLWLLTVIVPITAYYIWKLQKAKSLRWAFPPFLHSPNFLPLGKYG